MFAFVILFLIFCVPGLYAGVTRACNRNTPLNKNIAIFSACIAIICGVISLTVFSSQCLPKIEDEYTNVEWDYGVAFGLLAAAVGVKFVDCLFNGFIGTVAAAEGLLKG